MAILLIRYVIRVRPLCQKYKGTMFWLNIPHFFTLATRRVRPWQRAFSSAHAQTSSKAIFSNNPYEI